MLMNEVKLNAWAALVQHDMSNATAEKVDEIKECLRLRAIALELQHKLWLKQLIRW